MSKNKTKPKILFGFSNIASMLDHTMCFLEETGQYEIRGVALQPTNYHTFNHPNWVIVNRPNNTTFQKIKNHLLNEIVIIKNILWADKIYLIYNLHAYTKTKLYLRVLKLIGKKKQLYIEWVGDDVRFPERAMQLNPYYKYIVQNSQEYNSKSFSYENQQSAIDINAVVITSPEVSLFLNPRIIKGYYNLLQRININNYPIAYPSLKVAKPILVHAPSKVEVKGTVHVRAVVQQLKDKGLNFEYIELTKRPHHEAMNLIANCDIFIDQFYVGGYGVACCEAMLMGKPSLVYLMPAALDRMVKDIPLVNCSIDTLHQTLEDLINNPTKRNAVGKSSRAFMEKYYNSENIKNNILGILEGSSEFIPNSNLPADFIN